jgi:hypothetical protein
MAEAGRSNLTANPAAQLPSRHKSLWDKVLDGGVSSLDRRSGVSPAAFFDAISAKSERHGGFDDRTHVPATFETAQAGANVLAPPAESRIVSQACATIFNLGHISRFSRAAPGAKGVIGDAEPVSLSMTRQSKQAHG